MIKNAVGSYAQLDHEALSSRACYVKDVCMFRSIFIGGRVSSQIPKRLD